MNVIGFISLNLSTCLYLIWFFPQLLLNFKRKDTQGLSIFMCGILVFAYLSDLIYGFGLHMQWQYRLVTIIGLCSLMLEHYQFGRYGLHCSRQKYIYIMLSALYFFLLCSVFYIIFATTQTRNFYDRIGVFSNCCWFTYMLPQVIKNYLNRSTIGLSCYFVLFGIALNFFDSISAWTLDWDYPSKMAPGIAFLGNFFLLFQIYFYGKKNKSFNPLVVSS